MTGPGDELAELLWDHGPALRRPTPPPPPSPFQPFSCSAAGSSRAREFKRHASASKPAAFALPPLGMLLQHDAVTPLGLPVHDGGDDDAVPPWLHCPVVDDADADDTAPLPPEYCASLLPAEYSTAVPPEPAVPAKQAAPPPAPAEGVMNFTFFSRPLQRPQAAVQPVESTAAVQAAATTNRLRSTPLFSEQRMAWLQPPKAPRAGASAAVVAPPPHRPLTTQAPLAPPDGRCRGGGVVGEAATVAQTPRGMQQPEARAAAPDAVTTSSVCSGNGDRSQSSKRSGSSLHHHQPADCSVSLSQDELDLDDEGGATRRSSSAAARGSKRSRTAEVHNLSERRRRDRINEKMRALQELIPNCNKIDKASMLEEAIEYLKTLQLQVQMMSMGTGLCVPPPMLLPHPGHPMAQYAHYPHHHLAMGLGFGAFDMLPLPRVPAHFPCPPMAMPAPGPMFGVPSPAAMFTHAAAAPGAAPPEQMEAAAPPAPARPGAAERLPVPAAAQAGQGGRELQRPAEQP